PLKKSVDRTDCDKGVNDKRNMESVLVTSLATAFRNTNKISRRPSARRWSLAALSVLAAVLFSPAALAQSSEHSGHTAGGEADLKLPQLSQVNFLGIDGHSLLLWGLLICFLGLLFGLAIYTNLKKLPVHRSMREISELIYETCKTYLLTQGKFIL